MIADISTDDQTKMEWLTVKYDGAKIMKFQRFQGDLRPIGMDSMNDAEYEPKAEVMTVIADKVRSANGREVDLLDEYHDSATMLLNDLDHFQYEHGVDRDDMTCDAAHAFFTDFASWTGCKVTDCPFVLRHHRERGRLQGVGGHSVDTDSDEDLRAETLLDIMALIHCHFIHCFDLNRLSKSERESVTMLSASSLDEVEDEEKESSDLRKMEMITGILADKRQQLDLSGMSDDVGNGMDTVPCCFAFGHSQGAHYEFAERRSRRRRGSANEWVPPQCISKPDCRWILKVFYVI